MKKQFVFIFILMFMLFLVGCVKVTTSEMTTSSPTLDSTSSESTALTSSSTTTLSTSNLSTTPTTTMTTILTTIPVDNPSPTNVRIEEAVLLWDSVENAVSYLVSVDGTSETSFTNSYSLNQLAYGRVYQISVEAVFASVTNSVAVVLYYDNLATMLLEVDLAYDVFDPQTMVILEGSLYGDLRFILNEENQALENNIASNVSNQWVINNAYLSSLEFGQSIYQFVFESGIVTVTLTVHDSRVPYLISSNQINVVLGEDITLLFQLYSGVFMGLSGNDITIDDYTFDGTTLVISGSYVSDKFTLEPDRTTLILAYSLDSNDRVTIGYLFIRVAATQE